MRKSNEFRIAIAIEDEKSGKITLLVANEVPENRIALDDEGDPTRDLLPRNLEGTFTCSVSTWLRIKAESTQQGAQWTKGVTKKGSPYWSSKPKVTVIHVDHGGLIDGLDPAFTLGSDWKGPRLEGDIDGRVSRIVIRGRRVESPIEGL